MKATLLTNKLPKFLTTLPDAILFYNLLQSLPYLIVASIACSESELMANGKKRI